MANRYEVKDSQGRLYKVSSLCALDAILVPTYRLGADVNQGAVRLEGASEWRPYSQVKAGASCPRCGGWTGHGGMSQYAKTPAGCNCHAF